MSVAGRPTGYPAIFLAGCSFNSNSSALPSIRRVTRGYLNGYPFAKYPPVFWHYPTRPMGMSVAGIPTGYPGIFLAGYSFSSGSSALPSIRRVTRGYPNIPAVMVFLHYWANGYMPVAGIPAGYPGIFVTRCSSKLHSRFGDELQHTLGR